MASETLYADFFGLSERPFTLVPDPSFIYWSDQHKRAFESFECRDRPGPSGIIHGGHQVVQLQEGLRAHVLSRGSAESAQNLTARRSQVCESTVPIVTVHRTN